MKYIKLFYCLLIIMLLASCVQKSDIGNTGTSLVENSTQPSSITESKKKVVEKYSEEYFQNQLSSEKCPMIAAIPEKDIYLYLIGNEHKGVLLTNKGHHAYYDWIVSNKYLPRMSLMDVDTDGSDELIIINTLGHGTGAFEEDLHIIKIDEADSTEEYLDKYVSEESLYYKKNPLYLQDYHLDFFGESTFDEIRKSFHYRYYKKKGKLYLDITFNEETTTLKVNKKEDKRNGPVGYLGGVGYYSIRGNKIILELGVMFGFLNYIGTVSSEVHFNNGNFSFDNIKFHPYDELD